MAHQPMHTNQVKNTNNTHWKHTQMFIFKQALKNQQRNRKSTIKHEKKKTSNENLHSRSQIYQWSMFLNK